MDLTTALAIGKLLQASIILTAILVILQTMGYSISGVLAFGGIGGIAIGFAARRKTYSNAAYAAKSQHPRDAVAHSLQNHQNSGQYY